MNIPYPKLIVSIFLSLAMATFAIHAQATESKPPFADKAELYDHFKDPALIKALYFKARDLSIWVSTKCAKGEKNCNEALDVMMEPFSQWNNLDGKNATRQVINCDAETVVAHPNPALHKIVGKRLAKIIRDINGKLWVFGLCEDLKESPDGYWTSQFSSWDLSITGMNEVWVLSFAVQVPGTSYQVLSHIPHYVKTPREIDAKVEELNGLVKKWSAEWSDSQLIN